MDTKGLYDYKPKAVSVLVWKSKNDFANPSQSLSESLKQYTGRAKVQSMECWQVREQQEVKYQFAKSFDGGLFGFQFGHNCSMDRFFILLSACLTANKIKDFTIAYCGPPLRGKHGRRSME